MKLKNVLLMATVLAVSAVAPATGDTRWVSLRLKEAGMVFEMPAQPKLVDAKDVPMTAYALMTADGLLTAGFSDALPVTTDHAVARKMLEGFDQGLSGSANLTPAGFREVVMQGFQARVSAFKGKDDTVWRVVSVVRGDRIGFQVFIGRKDKLAGATATRFFNSLKLASL